MKIIIVNLEFDASGIFDPIKIKPEKVTKVYHLADTSIKDADIKNKVYDKLVAEYGKEKLSHEASIYTADHFELIISEEL